MMTAEGATSSPARRVTPLASRAQTNSHVLHNAELIARTATRSTHRTMILGRVELMLSVQKAGRTRSTSHIVRSGFKLELEGDYCLSDRPARINFNPKRAFQPVYERGACSIL